MPVHVPGMEEDTMMTNSNEGLTGPVNPLAEGDTIRCCFPLVATEEHSKEQAVRIGDVKNIVIELIEKDDISRLDKFQKRDAGAHKRQEPLRCLDS
ncbi:hypothetical protein H2202_007574 [Exophiala xenobiotica]|nr:hypothetical protein H2202_007574 [Exophiala xenobiotica]